MATTSMLTQIAYRFMVGGTMPPVPCLPRMDYFILGSTLLVFAALAQDVITSRISDQGNLKPTLVVDRVCHVLFQALSFAILTGSFSLKFMGN